MNIDVVTIIISCVSLIVALYMSVRRYKLQQEQLELQTHEFDEKFKLKLHIKDECFLTSHRLEPEKINYFTEHPDEIEFEYRAN